MSRAVAQRGIVIVSESEGRYRKAQLSQSLMKIKIAIKTLVHYRRCRQEGPLTVGESGNHPRFQVQVARHSDAAHGQTRTRGSGQDKTEERPRRDCRVVGSKQYHRKDTRQKQVRREKEGQKRQELTRANSLESPPPTLPDMVPAATNHFVLLPRRVDAARPGSSLLQTIL